MPSIHQDHKEGVSIKDRLYNSNPVPVIDRLCLAIRKEILFEVNDFN